MSGVLGLRTLITGGPITWGQVKVGRPDINETERIAWVSLDKAVDMITSGGIAGAGSVIGILYVLARRRGSGLVRKCARIFASDRCNVLSGVCRNAGGQHCGYATVEQDSNLLPTVQEAAVRAIHRQFSL